jgi:hypothetical protein
MDEVHDDRHGDAAGIGFGLDALDLVDVAVPEDGGEAAGVAGLDSTSAGPVGVENVDPFLPHGTQVHVVLE